MSWRDRPLVVVAEASAGAAVSRSLEPLCDVAVAVDERSLVEQARELRPDALIVLTSQGSIDVFSAMARLVESPETEHLPVIVLADPYIDADAIRALRAGAADYLSGAITPPELFARVEKAIREHRLRSQLSDLARTDHLTGLANYRALAARLVEEFNRADRYEYPLSVVMIDLDHLKQLNDRFGHDTGNRALLALTQTLRASLRQTDFAARYGGDEFVVLAPHQTPGEAEVMVERVRKRLSAVQLTGPSGQPIPFRLSLSVGIAAHAPDERRPDPESLLHLADAALYEAKRSGRDRVVIFGRQSVEAVEGTL